MQLTVRQFLTLLSDSRRATQSAEAASATTNDVGVQCSISDMLHRQAQTDPADEQPVPPRRDAAVQCALETPTAPPVHPPQNRRPPARESVKDGVRHEECAGQTRDAKRVRFAPQGDRPLPAPREAGPWAPAFGGAGLGRLGEWRPPGPSRFRFHYCFFFFLSCSLLLCGTVEPCD